MLDFDSKQPSIEIAMAPISNVSVENEKIKRKKGLKQVIYKSEIIKKAKLKGTSYINYSGRRISAVRPGVCR